MPASDIGLVAVEELFTDLMVDEEWAERRPRGFSWWSHRLAQHIGASPPVIVGGREVCEVRVWTDVARDVEEAREPLKWLSLTNMRATLSALIWDPTNQKIADCCSVMVHAGNLSWVRKVLPLAAIMQNAAAHSRAQAIAEVLAGNPDTSEHPESGERPFGDDMLNAPLEIVNTSKSKFVGTMTRRLEALAGRVGLVGFSSQTEFSCELPFAGVMPVGALNDDWHVETSLLQVFSDAEHPDYGPGALMTLSLPARLKGHDLSEVSNNLNRLEFIDLDHALGTDSLNGARQFTLTGAWCPDPRSKERDRVAFNTFVPSVLARPGILENFFLYQILRSRFAASQLTVLDVSGATDSDFGEAADWALLEAITSKSDKETPSVLEALWIAEKGKNAAAEARQIATAVIAATRQVAAQRRVQPQQVQATTWFTAVADGAG